MFLKHAFLWCIVCFVIVAGCAPNYDHDPCQWENKGGFQSHDCPMTLMCLQDFVCPDGQVVSEYNACSGPRCDTDSDCISSHFCYAWSARQGYCMPYDECPTSDAETSSVEVERSDLEVQQVL